MLSRTLRTRGSKLVFTTLCPRQDIIRRLEKSKCSVEPCYHILRHVSGGRIIDDLAHDQKSNSSHTAAPDQPPPFTFTDSSEISLELWSDAAESGYLVEDALHPALASTDAVAAERKATMEQLTSDYAGRSYSFLKVNRPSPYITLYDAIAKASPETARLYRPPSSCLDLSFKNPDVHAWGKKLSSRPGDTNASRMAILAQLPTLWSITAKMIVHRQSAPLCEANKQHIDLQTHDLLPDDKESSTLGIRLNDQEHAYLMKWKVTLASIEQWVSIILEQDMDDAVTRLHQLIFSISVREDPTQANHLPLFVIMLLLKRLYISSHSLQKLLHCTWHVVRFPPAGVTFEDRQIFILFVRLVRHATKVLPSFLPNITALLTKFTPKNTDLASPSAALDLRRLTALYNSGLGVLTYVSGETPFRGWTYQARAQFMLVSHMVNFNPPLDISSHGFAALVKAQLRHQKTPQEDEWAKLQSRGWPPYSNPRTAMDEDKGFEFAASRAMKTLQYMRQAGYDFPHWERVASIYAGWDDERTPTIQTRYLNISLKFGGSEQSWESTAMAARVRTTRDIREAWAQFLRYEDAQLPFSASVYWQMFDRIYQETERLEGRQNRSSTPGTSTGDMKELIPPATSPMQKVYLPSEPPSFMEFFSRMMRREPAISSSFLGALMAMSPSISDGITIWDISRGDPGAKSLIPKMIEKALPDSGVLEEWRTFSGTILMLCRSPWDESASKLFDQWEFHQVRGLVGAILEERNNKWVQSCSSKAVFQALYLVRIARPHIQMVYTALLKGLIQAQYDIPIPERPPTFWFFPVVLEILTLLKGVTVTPEATFFDNLCHFMELGAFSSRKVLNMMREDKISLHTQSLFDDAQAFMVVGSTVLRRTFAALYKGPLEPSQLQSATEGLENVTPIPHALNAPTPVMIQHYIRALAIFQDYEGIYSLARWCGAHTSALTEVISQLPHGMEQWRHALAAFRIALQNPEYMFSSLRASQQKRAEPELVQLVKTALEEMQDIGGWANDAEVEDFKMHVALNAATRRHEWAIRNTG